MRKFEAHEVEVADIEIAKAFFAPGTMYLNRYIIIHIIIELTEC